MLAAEYIQKGLLFPPPPFPIVPDLIDHLEASLADTLATYYPVAGRFITEQHRDVVGCSVSIDCDGQGVEIVRAVADGVAISDGFVADDVPIGLVQRFFPLDGAVNYDGHHVPLFVVQVTELLRDGAVFLGFAYNHALSDGTAFWDFINAWAHIARARIDPHESGPPPLVVLKRWSADGGEPGPVVLRGYADASELIERISPPPLREKMLHFSAETLAALKEKARQELVAAGDAQGAAAVTRFQALSSLLWRCITRARRLDTTTSTTTVCRAAINNRGRLVPPLPREYFGNTIYAISTSPPVRASELLERGLGWAAAAVGRAVARHTDADIRSRVEAWTAKPVVYTLRFFDPNGTMMGSSPRFDMYGCDFGWGKPIAARSGRANKFDGKTSLYPGREGGGSIDAELVLEPHHMANLDHDQEFIFWTTNTTSFIPQDSQ
ncbi:hypothetical protein PR202_ga18437 [Eleusine coracana subsp. coracana]|uniref:Acetyltransferase n=1 Tax=Eleusine coracana subsp. coracana TaxID=191504 RepID=A0AAV5CT17_ELECO|nr:hypothetical protein PR202_ga18437 [Eleusine coracana subsp. coracana]